MVLLFASFGLPAYEGAARLGAIALMLWGFAPAGLALTYLLQTAFEVRVKGWGIARRVAGIMDGHSMWAEKI